MAVKHKCIECVHHTGWATPNGISEQNYSYAKHVLEVMERSMTCIEKNLVRRIDHELYCNKFQKADEWGMTAERKEKYRLNDMEQLRQMIEKYEKEQGIASTE